MHANSLIDVCRICPRDAQLLSVFNSELSVKYNMKEVLLLTTGVDILESDLISKKICQRCCNITLKMFQFRQDALKKDRELKELLSRYVENQGILTACTTDRVLIEGEDDESCSPCKVSNIEQGRPLTSNEDLKKNLHPTVAAIYNSYPDLKLPKKCFDRHVAPVVSLTMGDVESYFKKQKLDMKTFVDKLYSKKQHCNKVAKKKTSVLTKHKTVAPLKISKTVIKNKNQPGASNDQNYVCTMLLNKSGRKRKISSTDSDKGNTYYGSTLLQKKRGRPPKKSSTDADNGHTLPIMTNKNTELASQPTLKSVTENPESEIIKGNILPEKELMKRAVIKDLLAPEDSTVVSLTFPAIPSPSDTTFLSQDSSSSNILKSISLSSTSKPELIESLGLVPRTFTTKSETLLTCNVCGSVHKNARELKWHNRNHMVCQFCKRRFKSIEKKENHVDSFCKIKRIMNFTDPIVALEKIHLNLEVRKKHINAFSSFDTIPGLVEPAPLEHVVLEAASVAVDGVIVLSDHEEYEADPSDPLSDIPTPSADMPSPAIEKEIYKYVAEIRPDLKIKNNRVLNRLATGKSDKELIKGLIALVTPEQATCEQELQTNLPNSRDIKVNNSEGTCEFKYLSEKLSTYKIPIKVSYGAFNASYLFIDASNRNKMMSLWDDLPIIDHYKKSVRKPINASRGNKSVAHHNVSRQYVPLKTVSASPVLNLKVTSTTCAAPSPSVTVSSTAVPSPSPRYFTPPLFSPRSKIDSAAKQSMSPINLVVNNKIPRASNNVLNEINVSTSTAPRDTAPLVLNESVSIPKTIFSKNPSFVSRSSNINYSDPRSPVPVNAGIVHSFHSVASYPASGAGNIVTGHLPHADMHNSKVHNNMVLSAPVIQRPPANTSLVCGSIFTKNTESCSTNLPVSSCSTIPSSNYPKFRIKDVSELQ